MKYRQLGKTGFEISEVGFGAWPIGADWGGEIPEEKALGALHVAAEEGMNFIDTADVYGSGRSERLVGRFLKERSERIYVATKQGRFEGWDDSYETMKAHAIASMERLGVEVLDLLQLHCIPFEVVKRGEVIENLEKLRREGLILHGGLSVESVEEALYCLELPVVSSLQVIFNVFRQKLVDELFPQAEKAGVGLLARVPLASGLLSGKYGSSHIFGEGDHRSFNANGECFNVGETFAGVPFERGVEFAQEVEGLLPSGQEHTAAQLALRWILDHAAISAVIPGIKDSIQAVENAGASGCLALPGEVHARLRKLYEEKIHETIRGVY